METGTRPSAQAHKWEAGSDCNRKKLMGLLQMFPMASLEQLGCNEKESNTKK
jgi:hypothetical protein